MGYIAVYLLIFLSLGERANVTGFHSLLGDHSASFQPFPGLSKMGLSLPPLPIWRALCSRSAVCGS